MSVQIAGVLLDPYGEIASFAEIQFITLQGAGEVMTTSPAVYKTSADGSYSINVQFGVFAVLMRYNQSNGKFQQIKKVIVNSNTVATTLGELLLSNEPLTPPEIAYVEQLVLEAKGYRDETLVLRNETVAAAESVDGVYGYDSRSAMDADLAPKDGSIAYVTNDPTATNNGTYRKSGATGTGSWVQSSGDLASQAYQLATENVKFRQGTSINDFSPDLIVIDTLAKTITWNSLARVAYGDTVASMPATAINSFVGTGSFYFVYLKTTDNTLHVYALGQAVDVDTHVSLGYFTEALNTDPVLNGFFTVDGVRYGNPYVKEGPDRDSVPSIVKAALEIDTAASNFSITGAYYTSVGEFTLIPNITNKAVVNTNLDLGITYIFYSSTLNTIEIVHYLDAAAYFKTHSQIGSLWAPNAGTLKGVTWVNFAGDVTVDGNVIKSVGYENASVPSVVSSSQVVFNINSAGATFDADGFYTNNGVFQPLITAAAKPIINTTDDFGITYIMIGRSTKTVEVVHYLDAAQFVGTHDHVGSFFLPASKDYTQIKSINFIGPVTIDNQPIGGAESLSNRFSTKQAFYFGDSITFGFPDGSYVGKVTQIVEPGGFTNFGSSGAEAGRLVGIMTPVLDRQGGGSYTLPDYSLAAFCTIQIGTNGGVTGTVADVKSFPETCWDVPYSTFSTIEQHLNRYPDSYYGNIALILDYITFINKEMEVFLIDIPVEIGFPTQHLDVRTALDEIHQEFAVKRVYACNEGGITYRNGIPSGFMNADGTHLTVAGADKWGKQIGYSIKKYR